MTFLRPTLKDVAKLSGVSEISVSRVMRDAPNISFRLREKVEAAALELHYTPNKVAGALASNTTDLIGIMVPTLKNAEYTKILASIESVLGRSKYRLMLGVSDFSIKRETKIIRDFLAWSPSGVIMLGAQRSDAVDQLLERSKSLRVEILSEEESTTECAFGISYEQAATDLASYWIEKRCRNVVYVAANEGRLLTSNFKDTLKKQLENAGNVSLQLVQLNEPASIAQGMKTCAEILQQTSNVDAIFFEHADLAVGASFYCSTQQNHKVALASFDNSFHLEGSEAAIDLVQIPFESIGASAANFFTNINNTERRASHKKIMLPASFVKSRYTP